MTLLLQSNNFVAGQTFNVPGDFDTLQAALDWLGSVHNQRNTINITAEEYGDVVTYISHTHRLGSLTIQSDPSIHNSGGRAVYGRGIEINSAPFPITIKDLEFKTFAASNYSTPIHSIQIFNANVTLENVLGNSDTSLTDGTWGMYFVSSNISLTNSGATLTNNGISIINSRAIMDNASTTVVGIGTQIVDGSHALLSDGYITGNRFAAIIQGASSAIFQAGTYVFGSNWATLVDHSSFLIAKGAELVGGNFDACRVQGGSSAYILNSTVRDADHYGVRAIGNAEISLSNNTYSNNTLGNSDPATPFTINANSAYRTL